MNTIVLKKNAYLRIFFNRNLIAIAKLPTLQKREQELRSLRSIDDSFLKFVITEDPIKKYHDDNGVVFMNIYEFLMDGESLKG
ncbi:MAG: hypothetical protein GX416_04385 [Bacteroidales bacterium]|nr:hypothetical protein [Bacteroidales bacterium]